MNKNPKLLRLRQANSRNKVTYIELFFDLVFVFAVTQLSHSLLHHFTLLGAVQTAMLLLAVWWVWMFTSWATNWLNPEQLPVRLLLLALMFAGLLLSSSLPQAFNSLGLVFAGAYASMQVGRTLFALWAVKKHHDGLTLNFLRILAWLSFSAVFWIAGGLQKADARMLFWGTALLIEYISPWAGFWTPRLGRSVTDDWNVEGEHIAERCALFIIIALGESILVTGASFSEHDWNAVTTAAFTVAFVSSVTMWWLYFDVGAEAGSHIISHSRDPGRIARLAYTYLHLFIVAGIIVSAVADELLLEQPLTPVTSQAALAILGGTALYLLGITLFKWTIAGRFPFSHLLGLFALAALIPAAAFLSPLLLSLATTLVLFALAAWERYNAWRCFPQGT